jgi:hypothetical protein
VVKATNVVLVFCFNRWSIFGSLDDLLLRASVTFRYCEKSLLWTNPEAEAYGADLILFIAVLIVKKSNHFLSLLKF